MAAFADKVRRIERIRSLLRKRYGEQEKVAVTHPVEHVIRAVLQEEADPRPVENAMDRLRRHFMDWNDLRVSRPREIREVLGPEFPRVGHKARVIPRLLDQVYKDHNSMVWDFLEGLSKTEVRTYFEKLEDVRPFVAATMARDCVGAHAFPVDNDVARVLGRIGIVDPSAQTEAEMQMFLERAVKASRALELHWLVKRLGQELCLVGAPLCADCPLGPMCPSAVYPPQGKGKAKKPAAAAAKTAARKSVKAPAKAAAVKPRKASAPAARNRPARRRK